MANYKKSADTKQKIIDASKKLFYEKGYTDTSCKEICDTAGVNLGLIHYHFKTKKNIATIIYTNTLLEVKELVRVHMIKAYGYYELKYGTALENWVYMTGFLDNKKYKKFYYEICKDNLLIDNNTSVIEFFYKLHVNKYKLNISPNEVKLIQVSSASISMGIVEKFVDNFFDMTLEELIEYKIRNIYQLMNLNVADIDDIVKTSYEMYKSLNIEFNEYFNVYSGSLEHKIFYEPAST